VIGHDFSILGQKLALPKKASDGEVFIQFIPGDAYAMSHETPLGALLGGSRKEAREPHEGRAQFTTIGQDDSESFRIGTYVDCACIKLNH
jgi:hypothetical protein